VRPEPRLPPRTYPRRPELIIGERRCQPRVMAKRRGRPPRSEVERAAQRTRLIEAAMDAVRAGGGDISVADIADSAEVSKPVLYAEFGDKNGIADAISVVLADIVEQRIPQATGSPSDPGDRHRLHRRSGRHRRRRARAAVVHHAFDP
jgi:AcrR family transcriptional regulator